MKKKWRLLTFLLVAALLVPAAAPVLAAPRVRQIDYVALGDSMAAGVLGKDVPDSTHTDFGYPNVIAEYLGQVPNTAYSFDKSYCEGKRPRTSR
jgi:hypothetical protein